MDRRGGIGQIITNIPVFILAVVTSILFVNIVALIHFVGLGDAQSQAASLDSGLAQSAGTKALIDLFLRERPIGSDKTVLQTLVEIDDLVRKTPLDRARVVSLSKSVEPLFERYGCESKNVLLVNSLIGSGQGKRSHSDEPYRDVSIPEYFRIIEYPAHPLTESPNGLGPENANYFATYTGADAPAEHVGAYKEFYTEEVAQGLFVSVKGAWPC